MGITRQGYLKQLEKVQRTAFTLYTGELPSNPTKELEILYINIPRLSTSCERQRQFLNSTTFLEEVDYISSIYCFVNTYSTEIR